ncbi:UbiA family prenyltransferase [Jiella sp. MQZ9-1]|uniref:UbiA family prenyltransferase n=1 Tax=Jiella flava TaxID=2816857 RepID=A0A939G343_9HYPH|nr:UbiA family prenyltransferase [Jiella flava]MBO0664352.1 UbiA family prenyltransferase [Jiella flava]MCD2472988.1 UbiA family prenyltransferase [Jiella flava]
MDACVGQQDRPIYVDLDGTLIKSDLLWESLFLTARQKPLALLGLPGWLAAGKARLKAELAKTADLDPALLPYRAEVIAALEEAKANGRRIILATGANERLARAVADHLGLFDEVMASCDAVNLTAHRKLERISADCGAEGFDYYGNSHEDVCLLDGAAEATVVAPDRTARRWQQRVGAELIEAGERPHRAALKAMRPHQWAKNVLVFVPLILSHEFLNVLMITQALLACLAFSFAASSVYILNDLLDLTADRKHKTKRHRPFASGALAIPQGVALAAGLLGTAALIGLLLPATFLLVLAGYLVATSAYSLVIKRMLLIDVLTLAGLYTTRIIAGVEATNVSVSFWLLAFSLFFFLSLALVKRYTELMDFGMGAERSKTGRGYVDADLETLSQAGMASGFAAVMVLALYINSPAVAAHYKTPWLVWPLCPILLYIIVRIWVLARRNQMHDDPVVFILQDWRSQMMIAIGAVMFLLAAYA